ncbi:MAG: hypothetical protein CL484_12035 [Acidobacteria bacterium]|nr:hypothetical protein [Acidobacteriota bacterium]|tara:strand:+ start:1889 stop:2326 length:438 start_codon:yes stop_codon:yes gene_type:complete
MKGEKKLQKDLQYSIGSMFHGNSYIRVSHPDQYEQRGIPDLLGHIFGIHIEIELKVHPNRPSGSQVEQMRRVNESGGYACVILYWPKRKEYYLVEKDNISEFSYRKRESWVRLPHANIDGRVIINLTYLYCAMVQKLESRYANKS